MSQKLLNVPLPLVQREPYAGPIIRPPVRPTTTICQSLPARNQRQLSGQAAVLLLDQTRARDRLDGSRRSEQLGDQDGQLYA